MFGFLDMSGPVISYVPFDELVASLRAAGPARMLSPLPYRASEFPHA